MPIFDSAKSLQELIEGLQVPIFDLPTLFKSTSPNLLKRRLPAEACIMITSSTLLVAVVTIVLDVGIAQTTTV